MTQTLICSTLPMDGRMVRISGGLEGGKPGVLKRNYGFTTGQCGMSCESPGKSYASGEYATHLKYGYGRVEARIKAAKGTGLVTSLLRIPVKPQARPMTKLTLKSWGKTPRRWKQIILPMA